MITRASPRATHEMRRSRAKELTQLRMLQNELDPFELALRCAGESAKLVVSPQKYGPLSCAIENGRKARWT